MGAFDSSLGVLLIGTWANAMFYMLEILQIIKYVKQYPKDIALLKSLVFTILVVDTVGTASTFGTVYMYCVTFWGNGAALQKEYWSYPVYCGATAISAALGQGFLISRFFTLSHNYVVTAVLSLAAMTAISGAFWMISVIVPHNTLSARGLLTTPVIVWFGGSTACDILLACSLVWQLHKVKTTFRNTENMLKRLTRSAISTGSITGAWALFILIVFTRDPGGSVAVSFNTCFGRVYALTVLYNLNMRHSIRQTGTRNFTTLPTRAGDLESGARPPVDLSQIQVERTVNVITDMDRDEPKKADLYQSPNDTPSHFNF